MSPRHLSTIAPVRHQAGPAWPDGVRATPDPS